MDDEVILTFRHIQTNAFLQEVRLHRSLCQDGLSTNVGAVQLIGFTSETDGRQSILEDIEERYLIRNEGSTPAKLLSAVSESSLTGTHDLLGDAESVLDPGSGVSYSFQARRNVWQDSAEIETTVSVVALDPLQNRTCSGFAVSP